MIDLFYFIFFFYISIISILGYGKIFEKVFLNKVNYDEDITIYLGFYGITLLTLISLFTSFFLNIIFIIILLFILIGISYFFFYCPLKKYKNFIKLLFIYRSF